MNKKKFTIRDALLDRGCMFKFMNGVTNYIVICNIIYYIFYFSKFFIICVLYYLRSANCDIR